MEDALQRCFLALGQMADGGAVDILFLYFGRLQKLALNDPFVVLSLGGFIGEELFYL